VTTSINLAPLRAAARALLDERAPRDALACYYAFYHAADRTELFAHQSPITGLVEGVLIRARTGMDLFRPLVTLRATTAEAALTVTRAALRPGWPVYLTVPEIEFRWVQPHLTLTDPETHRLYALHPARLQTFLNVLVVTSTAPDGAPRCEIRSGNRAGALAGVNWQSPQFAEIYVYTDPAVRGRGWGKAVVSTLAGLMLKAGRLPLYVVADHNEYSIRLAEAVGFEDTGHREYSGQAALMA
jgi:GNAT superfamily N-acetyltransferase